MVTEGKLFNTPLARYRLGSTLVWFGVFTWVPFIFLRVVGQRPSFWWFLPFHLVGVIVGSRLRAHARKELGTALVKKDLWRVIGHGLIWLGIGVWVPYFYLKLILGEAVDVVIFLPYHLTGVLGGVLTLVVGSFVSKRSETSA